MASYIEKAIHGGVVTFKPKTGQYPAGLDVTVGRYTITIRNRKTIHDMLAAIEGVSPSLVELENE